MNLNSIPKLYHVSNTRFAFPSIPNQVEDGKHINGMLGFWISPFPEYCMAFGNIVYKVSLKQDRRDLVYPLKRLKDAHDRNEPLEYYLNLRSEWQAACDVVWIEDSSHEVGEVIVVNLMVIDKFEHVNYKPRRAN